MSVTLIVLASLGVAARFAPPKPPALTTSIASVDLTEVPMDGLTRRRVAALARLAVVNNSIERGFLKDFPAEAADLNATIDAVDREIDRRRKQLVQAVAIDELKLRRMKVIEALQRDCAAPAGSKATADPGEIVEIDAAITRLRDEAEHDAAI